MSQSDGPQSSLRLSDPSNRQRDPDLFAFLPKSYILPTESSQFQQALNLPDGVHIYKRDEGSLGNGIRIISPDQISEGHQVKERSAVAQEYIKSDLIDD
jgi:hypothetical protein